jgi:hypothetical protein
MNDTPPRWQDLYQATLLELDRDKLLQRIELAEDAIRERVATRVNVQELQAMQDALRALGLLRRSMLRRE